MPMRRIRFKTQGPDYREFERRKDSFERKILRMGQRLESAERKAIVLLFEKALLEGDHGAFGTLRKIGDNAVPAMYSLTRGSLTRGSSTGGREELEEYSKGLMLLMKMCNPLADEAVLMLKGPADMCRVFEFVPEKRI